MNNNNNNNKKIQDEYVEKETPVNEFQTFSYRLGNPPKYRGEDF